MVENITGSKSEYSVYRDDGSPGRVLVVRIELSQLSLNGGDLGSIVLIWPEDLLSLLQLRVLLRPTPGTNPAPEHRVAA